MCRTINGIKHIVCMYSPSLTACYSAYQYHASKKTGVEGVKR